MKRNLFYVFYLTSPTPLIYSLYMANPDKYDHLGILAAMLVGAMAYTWLIWQFVLSARPKFIDLYIGLDKVYRLHGIMAIVAILLVVGHKTILEKFYKENLMTFMGSSALALFVLASAVSVLVVTKDRWRQVRLFKKLQQLLKRVKYEHHLLLHNSMIVALLLMQVHVLMTTSAKNSVKVFNTWMAYFMAALMFYIYHKILKPWIQKEYPCKVTELKEESPGTWSVFFKPINHHLSYKPGQFGFFTFIINGRREVHPFSFSSSSLDQDIVSVTVKGLGDFTNSIQKIKVGDVMYVEGPFGEFTYHGNTKELSLCMIAGGVGITPVMSMLRHIRETNKDKSLILLLGARTPQDIIFKGELTEMEEDMPNLTLVPVISGDPGYHGETGYIGQRLIEKYLLKRGFQLDYTGFYICGPPPLRKGSIKSLKRLGIKKHQIHFETFDM